MDNIYFELIKYFEKELKRPLKNEEIIFIKCVVMENTKGGLNKEGN